MEWRGGRGRCAAVVAMAAVLITVANPARAHDGHHVVLASDTEAGPYQVTVWTSDGWTTDEMPVAIEVNGINRPSSLRAVVLTANGQGGPISVVLKPSLALGPAVWEGVLPVSAAGEQQLVVEISDAGNQYSTNQIPFVPAVASAGWAVLVGVLSLQAFGFLAWLARRAPRVWRRVLVAVS